MKEDLEKVWEESREGGSRLVVLLAVAYRTGADAWCRESIPDLAQQARVGERQCQKLLSELVAAGHLEVQASSGGRGKHNAYRVTALFSENGEQEFTVSAPRNGELEDTVSKKGEQEFTVSVPRNGELEDTVSKKGEREFTVFVPRNGELEDTVLKKGEREFTVSGLQTAFSPRNGELQDTLFAPYKVDEDDVDDVVEKKNKRISSSSSAPAKKRSLSASQAAVARFLSAVREAGLGEPGPRQVAAWLKRLRLTGSADPIQALLALLDDQLGRGLEGKRDIWAYFHKCVNSTQGGVFPAAVHAGGDEQRSDQAALLEERSLRRAAGGRS